MSRTLVLTVNVVGLGPEATEAPEAELFGRFAHGRYTYNVGMTRLLDFLKARGLSATFFWPATEAARMPDQIARCAAEGHEIASMGWGFEDHAKLQPAAEVDLLTRAHALLEKLSGQTPVGFRAPTLTLSHATLPILAGLGYRYDSSFPDDDQPYSLAEFGAAEMTELPYAEGLHDAQHFTLRIAQPRVEKFFEEALDGLMATSHWGCMSLTPRGDIGVGRLARLDMVARILDRAAGHSARIVTARTALETLGDPVL